MIATTIAGLLLTCASAWAADLPVVSERKDDPTGAHETPVETVDQRDARMKWWREAKFGMFIHWGLYAVPAGTWKGKPVGDLGEWIMKNGQISAADYAGFAAQFNPGKFNADDWVRLARDAGMKYIVITSKHHDGFAMFESKASPYNICEATPFKRDPLKELAEACRKHNIKLGFYYSQFQDWGHPGGGAYGAKWDKAQEGDLSAYVNAIAIPQVKEILSNYGPVAVLWWDTPGNIAKADQDKLHDLLQLQPGIISNNRLGGGYAGDTETPEQTIPDKGFPGRDWETCMTLNDTWGYKSYDNHYKSTTNLLRNLVDIVSKGGNYLLNVGPTAEGLIPQPQVERLKEIGAWLAVNGDAIYGAGASPLKKAPAWGSLTSKPGRLYLHLFQWPTNGVLNLPLAAEWKGCRLLADRARKVETVAGEDGLTVRLPGNAPDKLCSVVEIEFQSTLTEATKHAP
jgi:alpha-L-fucosidase